MPILAFLSVMAWRQGRKQTVSPIDIQWRRIKKIMGASFFKKVGARFFLKKKLPLRPIYKRLKSPMYP